MFSELRTPEDASVRSAWPPPAPARHAQDPSGTWPTGTFARAQSDEVARPRAYPVVRAEIQTGDVLLFRGRGPFSQLIQWGSESVYSHAGFAARWEDRLLVFQATGLGASFVSLSAAVDAYDGDVDWFVPRPDVRAQLHERRLITAAVDLLGRRYGRGQILDLMWRMAMRKFRGRGDPSQAPREVFCSQYVSYCYRAGGFDLVPDTDDASTSPGDLAASGYLVHKGLLYADPDDKEERRTSLPGRSDVKLK